MRRRARVAERLVTPPRLLPSSAGVVTVGASPSPATPPGTGTWSDDVRRGAGPRPRSGGSAQLLLGGPAQEGRPLRGQLDVQRLPARDASPPSGMLASRWILLYPASTHARTSSAALCIAASAASRHGYGPRWSPPSIDRPGRPRSPRRPGDQRLKSAGRVPVYPPNWFTWLEVDSMRARVPACDASRRRLQHLRQGAADGGAARQCPAFCLRRLGKKRMLQGISRSAAGAFLAGKGLRGNPVGQVLRGRGAQTARQGRHSTPGSGSPACTGCRAQNRAAPSPARQHGPHPP